MYLRLLYFSIHWIKFPDGYQIAGFGGVRLVVNQSVVPVNLESSPEDRSQLFVVYTLRVLFIY